MASTPNLQLPEFGSVGVPSGRDLTTGMRRLDALAQLSAKSFATAPPADPVLGDRHIIEAPATGLFTGRELHVVAYEQTGWVFYVPRDGWIAVVGGALWIFDESVPAWVAADAEFFLPATTKGDMLVHDGTSLQRLPVGTDDQVLVADAAESLGVKWDTPSAGGGGGGNVNPDTHPISPTALDDEFEYGSAIDTTGARRAGSTGWTRTVYGTSPIPTDSIAQGALRLTVPTGHTTPTVYRQPIPGSLASYIIRAKLAQNGMTVNFRQGGIHLYHAATTRWMTCQYVYNSGIRLEMSKWTASGFSSNSASDVLSLPALYTGWLYLECEYTGSSIVMRWSLTGLSGSFTSFYSETLSTFFGAGNVPDYAGIHVNDANYNMFCDWFRRVS